MVLPNFQCSNPACDEEEDTTTCTTTCTTTTTTTTKHQSKCDFVEQCASSCAAYGRVCPCAARAAGRAACTAVDKLYTNDSQVFQSKPNFTKFNCNDLVITQKLGEGGFSVVHQVATIGTNNDNKQYAIKYLKRRIMVDPHTFELGAADLAVEANFLAQLSHRNIVQLHGITSGSIETNVASGKECGFFILIDLLKGDSLGRTIEGWRDDQKTSLLSRFVSLEFKEKRKAALKERLSIAVQITDAMIYLHSRKIIYRDLKPDNIGFDKDGTVKIFDFGLAKELKKEHLDGTKKLTGNTGSRRYMAPEVAKEQHYGLSVDVFSFGILLHELASLEKPYQGYSANKHMMQVVMGGERPKLDTHFPMELTWLLQKCWSATPTERPTFVAARKCLADLVLSADAAKSPKFGRVGRYRSAGGSPKAMLTSPMKARADGEKPDFSKMKPLSKPTRQTKSLGFLRKPLSSSS